MFGKAGRRPRLTAFFAVAFHLLAVCGTGRLATGAEPTPSQAIDQPFASTLVAPGHRLIVVRSSIQAAVDEARSGDVVFVPPGLYREAVRVSRGGLKIVGPKSAVIDGAGRTEPSGIRVAAPTAGAGLHGFEIYGLTVRNFSSNGIILIQVGDYRIVGGDYENNESYGIFPILSDNGRIASNHVSGSSDSGIYVGQSSHSTVVDNVCVNNTVGIEVENASSVTVRRNALHGNSIGILAVVLPNLTVKTTSGIDVDLNVVRNNNRENSTTEPGDPLALLPGGVGVLLVGADQTRVSANRVLNNGSAGIAVVSLPHKFAKLDRLIDPAPDRDSITANTVLGNGRQPDPRLGALPPRDLLWDQTGHDDCWRRNVYRTAFPPVLPSCAPALVAAEGSRPSR